MKLGLGIGLWRYHMGTSGFTPASLFDGGQQGHWSGGYNPSQGRMWQDSTGLTPVTAPGQPVGFVLDMSQGGVLGPELVTNGDGGNVLGWDSARGANATVASVSGRIRATSLDGTTMGVSQTLTGLTVGRSYRVTISGFNSTGNLLLRFQSNSGLLGADNIAQRVGGDTSFNGIVVATASTMYIGAIVTGITAGHVVEIDNISVRELPGNHATQPTALSRPTLARWPKGGRRNLMSISEPTVATVSGGGASGITDAAGFGEFSHSINFPKIGNNIYAYIVATGVLSGTVVTFSVFVAMDDGLPPTFGSSTSTAATNDFSLNIGNAEGDPLTYVVAHMGGGIYRVSVTRTIGANLNATGIMKYTSNSARGFRAVGFQLEVGSTLTPYQRVTTQYDITEAGVPDVWHLSNDGGDSLPVTLPAGTYGRARVNAAGLVTVDTVVDPVDALVSNQQVDVILRQGAFTPEEEANIRTYWARYAA